MISSNKEPGLKSIGAKILNVIGEVLYWLTKIFGKRG